MRAPYQADCMVQTGSDISDIMNSAKSHGNDESFESIGRRNTHTLKGVLQGHLIKPMRYIDENLVIGETDCKTDF